MKRRRCWIERLEERCLLAGDVLSAHMLRDINPLGETYELDDETIFEPESSSPTQLTAAGDKLFFVADDGPSGGELWMSDGTQAGTILVSNLAPDAESSLPSNLTFAPAIDSGTLFFTAETSIGRELWKSDLDGNVSLVLNVYPETDLGGRPVFSEWTVADPSLPVIRNDRGVPIVGEELAGGGYRFVNELGVEVLVSSTYPFSSNPTNLTPVGEFVYFAAEGVELDPEEDTPALFGRELWVTDGTEEGTKVVGHIADFDQLITLDDVHGNETTIRRPAGSFPNHLVVSGSLLYFTANGSTGMGVELWARSAIALPEEADDFLVRDIRPGGNSSFPRDLIDANGRLFFVATTSAGAELWVSDGTLAGTQMARDIRFGSSGSDPQELTALGDLLIFSANVTAASFG